MTTNELTKQDTAKSECLSAEQSAIAIKRFQELLQCYEEQSRQPEINTDEIAALDGRLIRTVATTLGKNSVYFDHFGDWQSIDPTGVISSWNTDKRQENYRRDVNRTIVEIKALMTDLEQQNRLAMPRRDEMKGDLKLALRLCKRLQQSAKVLTNRRKGKTDYQLADEYDAQDLLHAILRAFFKYTVQEDPLGKIAAVSSRADLGIEEIHTIIELKYARGPKIRSE